MSLDNIEKKIEMLERDYSDLRDNIVEIKLLLKDKERLKPSFLESSSAIKTFGSKAEKIIDKVRDNDSIDLKIMGYFDNFFIDKLKDCSDRVKIISNSDVRDNKKNKILYDALKKMVNYGAEVRFHSELHSRLISINNELIIGSVDLQDRCLSGNRVDACIWTNDMDVLKKSEEFFDRIWMESEKLNDDRIVLDEEYDNYNINDSLLEPWLIDLEGGEIKIVKHDDALWKSKKAIILYSPKSLTKITYKLNNVKKLKIDYYIKQKEYNEIGAGSPFIVESSDNIIRNNENDNRMIYMEIRDKYLRIDNGIKEKLDIRNLKEIKLNQWYHIVLNINCYAHSYEIKINNEKYTGIFPVEFNDISAIRTKYNFNNIGWTTYIGKIVLRKMD